MKKYALSLILLTALFVQGCGTPQVVRSLSTEQLNAQKSSRDLLEKYFQLIERMVQNQVLSFKREEDFALNEQIAIFQRKYKLEVSKPGADGAALLAILANDIKKAAEDTRQTKDRYDEYLANLVAKHKEILAMEGRMVAAQDVLNSYIQIQKADEVVGNAIFSTLGTDQEKMKTYADEINRILKSLKAIKGD